MAPYIILQDDDILFYRGKSIELLQFHINEDVRFYHTCLLNNFLAMNISKIKCIHK